MCADPAASRSARHWTHQRRISRGRSEISAQLLRPTWRAATRRINTRRKDEIALVVDAKVVVRDVVGVGQTGAVPLARAWRKSGPVVQVHDCLQVVPLLPRL
jgi:hypothetical protein